MVKKERTYTGQVVSDSMNKTIVVTTKRTFTHPRFHKIIRVNKKYKVHDEKEEAHKGDIVEFYQGRPKSKTKYMYFLRVVKPR